MANKELSTEYHKCSKEHGICKTLESKVKDRFHRVRSAGICVLVLTDLDKAARREPDAHHCYGYGYKENAKDNGLLFNHCPWCGNSLMWMRKRPEDQVKGEVK